MSALIPNPAQSNLIHQEQLRPLYSSMPSAFIANIITSSLLVFALLTVVDHKTLLIWLTYAILIIFLRFLAYIRYNKKADLTLKTQTREHLFGLGSSSSAAMPGLAGIILFPTNNPLYQVLCTFVLTGMNAGAVSTLSAEKYTFPLYISLALFPLMLNKNKYYTH